MWYEWFFEGIGTELVMLIIGLIIGGVSGYKIGIKRNGIQKQVAKDYVKQNQRLDIESRSKYETMGGINGNLRQVQKAKGNAEQTQIGSIK